MLLGTPRSQIILVKGVARVLKYLINLLYELVKPWKLYTQVFDLGVGDS